MFENNLHLSVGGGMVFLSNKCSKNLPQGFILAAGVKTMSTYAASFNTFNATTIPSGLHRRGRLARFLVVLSLAVILLAGSGFAFTAGAGDVVSGSADSGSTQSSSYVVLTVGSGDSIWSIARTVADGRDVRSVVDAIVTANSLSDGDVVAGQKIRVPLA
ncbi:MAG: LysM peptidoglycan-binding domain-containing protein [Actinobacteria bacterium]|nr:LysM peptidoglycan-binding domain-containing protein [Actinomycetota bacterium]